MHYKFLDGKNKSYKNITYAIKYNAEMRQITLYDGNQYTVYNSITDLANALEHKSTSYRKVVWCYNLSLMIAYIGEKHFDYVEKHSTKSSIVKYALMFQGDIIFKNLKEFYFSSKSLDKIKELNRIDDSITDEVVITWLSAEKEKSKCDNKVSSITYSQVGYIRRKLRDRIHHTDFKLLNQSRTKELDEIFAKCKNGSLSGINEQYINETKYVYCYDFKSFYPWIMCTQQFPNCRYHLERNLPINEFEYKANKIYKRWIATITFDYIYPKNKSNCRDWLNLTNETNAVTITNLDMSIIHNTYDYKIKSIDEFVGFNKMDLLPINVRQFIIEQYMIKETYNKDSDEYNDAKVAVNCIFGIFDTNPLKYNQDNNNPSAKKFPYVIGIFTAAYGRYFLWEIMHNHNPIHWDTDGFKTIDHIDLTEYNLRRKIPDIMLGQLICENELAELNVFGNKQYLLNDTLKLAGTSGEKAMVYFKNVLKRKPRAGDIIPPEYTSTGIWDKINGGGYKNLSFTIGSKFKNIIGDEINNEEIFI